MNCRSCRRPIPEKRLKALPNTRICVQCAEREVLPVRASQNPADPSGTDFAIIPGRFAERSGAVLIEYLKGGRPRW